MDPRTMMGFKTEGDQPVLSTPVTVRDWDAMKRAVWRSAGGWDIIVRTAVDLLERCEHTEGCPGAASDDAPCIADEYDTNVLVRRGCPDRETRMSALVLLAVARQHAPTDARKPADGPYFAPSREYFSEVLSSLAVMEIEVDRLRKERDARAVEPLGELVDAQLADAQLADAPPFEERETIR